MLSFFTVILTVVLILDCLVLGLLILIQLPKKEAGVGVAFGGGATDALFGAGSGNALTKLTKYTATAFFALVIVLAFMKVKEQGASVSETKRAYEKLRSSTPPPALPVTPAPEVPGTNAGATTTTPVTPVVPPQNMLFNTASNAAPAATTNANPPSAPAK
jgi:preprotein translocase subunit SecG